MTSSPVPYATYQGHRRGQSSTSAPTFGNGVEGSACRDESIINPIRAPLPPSSSSASLQRPVISVSQPGPSRAPLDGVNGSQSMGTAPPPLRSISTLRSKQTGNSSSSQAKTNDKEKGREATTASTSSSLMSSSGPIRRTAVSSTLEVPNATSSKRSSEVTVGAGLSATSSASSIPGHSKRHSYSSLATAPSGSQHTRSASSSTLPSNLPHHMSTAQRLRTTPTNGSSNASSPISTPRGMSPSLEKMDEMATLPESSTSLSASTSDLTGRRTVYRPGFQPRGTYRVRTDEFETARERIKSGRDASSSSRVGTGGDSRRELESQRLVRRLEKLLALHYESTPVSLDSIPAWLPNALRKTRQVAEEDKRIREEEMRIIKWEDDPSRKVCPICSTPFSLSIRKHHCRLCGRIVCASPYLSLPPGFESRSDTDLLQSAAGVERKCSTLVVADGKVGAIIKDQSAWDNRGSMMEGLEAKTRRGIRICKDCHEIIMRRQYMMDDGRVPPYLGLYEALLSLQKEIEQSLPEFQEMVLGLQKQDSEAALGTVNEVSEDILSPYRQDNSTSASSLAATKAKNKNSLALQRDAAQARKQLLANFANYDMIAKKIRNLDDEGNASLARIKAAIWTKANLFLQQNMFPLQSLPKTMMAKKDKKKTGSGALTPTSGNTSDASDTRKQKLDSVQSLHPDAKAGARALELVQKDPQAAKESLAVLEEQLRLVREYAASASKARKFQDATSLRKSAQDLEAEIQRLRRLGV